MEIAFWRQCPEVHFEEYQSDSETKSPKIPRGVLSLPDHREHDQHAEGSPDLVVIHLLLLLLITFIYLVVKLLLLLLITFIFGQVVMQHMETASPAPPPHYNQPHSPRLPSQVLEFSCFLHFLLFFSGGSWARACQRRQRFSSEPPQDGGTQTSELLFLWISCQCSHTHFWLSAWTTAWWWLKTSWRLSLTLISKGLTHYATWYLFNKPQ